MAHTLLLADDSVTIHRVVELTLAGQDIRVVSVGDGLDAIERLKAARPDIVLADVALPGVDGYEVARYVRSQPELRGVPVVLLAGAFEPVDDARLDECGAAGVLVKPFEPTAVISRVKELLGLKAVAPAAGSRLVTDLEGPRARPATAPPPPPAARSAAPPAPAPEGATSWDELRETSGLGHEAGSVESARGTRDDYLDSLDAAFDTLDAQLAGRGGPGGPPRPARREPRMPAALDPGRRAQAPAVTIPPAAAPPGRGDVAQVFDVDDAWFAATAQDPIAGAAPGVVGEVWPQEPPPAPVAASIVEQPPAPAPVPPPGSAPAPVPEPVAAGPGVADAFEALLAMEQGEPGATAGPAAAAAQAPLEITDALVERIAKQVAERLSDHLLRDAVTDVVESVSERLVREEIARIRGTKA